MGRAPKSFQETLLERTGWKWKERGRERGGSVPGRPHQQQKHLQGSVSSGAQALHVRPSAVLSRRSVFPLFFVALQCFPPRSHFHLQPRGAVVTADRTEAIWWGSVSRSHGFSDFTSCGTDRRRTASPCFQCGLEQSHAAIWGLCLGSFPRLYYKDVRLHDYP